MYKIGSMHQGVLERGTKTTSDSYIMYPARIGAFSVVMGRHYAHPDTSDIPFSYLSEENGKSVIVPGVNLRTVGTVRDGEKWPKRDKRKALIKTDLIIFDVLSPYTVQKIIKGRDLLLNLQPTQMNTSKDVVCNNLHFNAAALGKGIEYYTIAINKFLGDCLIEKLKSSKLNSASDIVKLIESANDTGTGKWLDLAGLLVPEECITGILDDIENDNLRTLQTVTEKLKHFYDNYSEYRWSWSAKKLQAIIKGMSHISDKEKLLKIISDWSNAAETLNSLILADARKEFTEITQTGFGIDGDQKVKAADFEAVRGTYDGNSFVKELKQRNETLKKTFEEMMAKINSLQ
jgi:hypothetical protein